MDHDLANKFRSRRMWSYIVLLMVSMTLAGKAFTVASMTRSTITPGLIIFGTMKSTVDSFANALGVPVADTMDVNLTSRRSDIFFNRLADVFTTVVIFIGSILGMSFWFDSRKLHKQLEVSKGSETS
jgi:hypothetical protein